MYRDTINILLNGYRLTHMTELIIDDSLAEQLHLLAQQEKRPIDAVIRSMLESYATLWHPSDWPLEIAQMAEEDTSIVWNEYAPDLSDRSRDILENEFGDYLLKRLSDDDGNSA